MWLHLIFSSRVYSTRKVLPFLYDFDQVPNLTCVNNDTVMIPRRDPAVIG
jgi:hypothetical protein